MATEPKPLEDQIADGKRIDQLLADPAVRESIADLDADYWKEAKSSPTDAGVLAAVSKARALGDLGTKLNAVVQNGKIATVTRERTSRR
jgi:hypothetical protein